MNESERVLSADEFHACEVPAAERDKKRWWTDDDLPWSVCMFCGVRQAKSGRAQPDHAFVSFAATMPDDCAECAPGSPFPREQHPKVVTLLVYPDRDNGTRQCSTR